MSLNHPSGQLTSKLTTFFEMFVSLQQRKKKNENKRINEKNIIQTKN